MYAQLFSYILGDGFTKGQPSPFFGLDSARWAREQLSPRDYLNGHYYEYWLHAICCWVDQFGSTKGLRTNDLLKARITTHERLERAAQIRSTANRQAIPGCNGPDRNGQYTSERYQPSSSLSIDEIGRRALFKVGDRVRVIHVNGFWHTRCYPYARGAVGTIHASYGLTTETKGKFDAKYHGPYPEVASQSSQRFYAPVYGVRFRGVDLFGEATTDPRLTVNLDLWEPHLELAL